MHVRNETPKSTTAEQRSQDDDLFKKYVATGRTDYKLRNQLAMKNTRLVTFVVNKFYNGSVEHKKLREDLIQEGQLGLFNAIDGFDPSMGFRFSTYATWWVRQAINSYLIANTLIHVPLHVRTAHNKTLKKLHEAAQQQREVRTNQITDLTRYDPKQLNVTERMLKCIIAAARSVWVSSFEDSASTRMHKQSSDSSGRDAPTLADIIPADIKDAETCIDDKKLIVCLRTALNELPERERNIIKLRYNIID